MKFKLLKYVSIFTLLLSLLTGCSDEHDFGVHKPELGESTIDISFNVPAVRTVSTRSVNEEAVASINVLIFESDSDNAVLCQLAKFTKDAPNESSSSGYDGTFTETTTNNQTKYHLTIKLNKELIGKNDLKFYFVANNDCSDFIAKSTTLTDVKEAICEQPADDVLMVMSSKVAGVSTLLSNEVQLVRSSAKITVTKHDDNTISLPFGIFGTAENASILAGAENIRKPYKEANLPISDQQITDEEVKYIWPTLVEDSPLFVIIKADFRGEEYYYRLNLTKTDDEGKRVNVQILPNYWYQVEINEVKTAGYATAAESLNHPASNEEVDYTIYDHAPVIYNMITDGIRELGVTHSIVRSDLEGDDTEAKYLYVKYYSASPGELDSDTDLPKIISAPDWITINDKPEPIVDEAIEGVYPEGKNTRGKMLRYNVSFESEAFLGTLEDVIVTEWKGLRRETIVKWEREFLPGNLCKAKLIINKSDGSQATINNYWTFLSADGSAQTESSNGINSNDIPILYGISAEANNGKVRDEGLHFPLLYGEEGERWSYSYELDFTGDNEKSLRDRDDFSWTIKYAGLPVQFSATSGKHTKGQDDVKITITRSEEEQYLYSTGSITLEVTPDDGGKKSTIKLNTYHTGFFHYDAQNHRMDTKDPAGYYYYEVAHIGTRYWLDRNLGARSARMYIMTADGTPHYGDESAKGGYYLVANYVKNAYQDPQMYDETEEFARLSPPGYGVPDQSVWDDLRKSSRFLTEAAAGTTQSFYTSYYHTGLPIGNIYFPKSRFTQGNDSPILTGETLTGYYWTKTAAVGTEKEEIGRWLKTLVISGETTSYINGHVENYHMSVRCVNSSKKTAVTNHTYFNVKGATHIYLYTGEGANKTATTTWPGHAVANYSTAMDWAYFTYQSSMFNRSDLKVIFNHVDANGIITTIGKNGDVGPLNNEGWFILDEIIGGSATRLGGWWTCDFVNGTVQFSDTKPN